MAELKDMDFSAYLASESEEDVDADTLRSTLLQGFNEQEEEQQEDMVITFTPGLSEKVGKLLEQREQQETQDEMTLFEKKQLEKKLKKKEKRREKRAHDDDEDAGDDGDELLVNPNEAVNEDDPFGERDAQARAESKKKRKEKHKHKKLTKEEQAEADKKAAELALLVGKADDHQKGYSLKKMMDREKKSKKSKRKSKQEQTAEAVPFKIDVDGRWAKLANPDYHIDQTRPEFKSTTAIKEAMRAVSEKRQNEAHAENDVERMVNSLKRKAPQSNDAKKQKQ
jgi:hypothetical protein